MADEQHLKLLKQGVRPWNKWRAEHPYETPDLRDASLMRADLRGAHLSESDLRRAAINFADLTGANLRGAQLAEATLLHANLTNTDLTGADLSGANLRCASLTRASLGGTYLDYANLTQANFDGADLRTAILLNANLRGAFLRGASLSRAALIRADLTDADLTDADLGGANLIQANLSGAELFGTKLERVELNGTVFVNLDLREAVGLETAYHSGPSEIGVSTIYKSEGKLPEVFLLGCGVPESLVTQIPGLIGALQPIQFHSCFISYSGKDEEFARRLHSRMRQAALRVWFAPEDMKGGDKLYDQIDRAIHYHDRLLLVLSESSLQSKWVETEIRRARKVELNEGRRKLFPIRLVSYEALQEWVCIDSTTGEDLAEEVRSYFIPDFSNWKNHDDVEQAFARLLDALKESV